MGAGASLSAASSGGGGPPSLPLSSSSSSSSSSSNVAMLASPHPEFVSFNASERRTLLAECAKPADGSDLADLDLTQRVAEVKQLRTLMRALSVEEKRKADATLLAQAVALAQGIGGGEGLGKGPLKKADYSKSFSGSAADTKKEKEAAELMRGEGGGEVEDRVPTRPCVCVKDEAGNHADTCPGCWIRVLNERSQVYLYVHNITRETVGARPANYVEPAGGGEEEEEEEEEKVPGCSLTGLPPALEEIFSRNKTPLVIDNHPEKKAMTYFSYAKATVVIDCRPMALGYGKTGKKMADVIEGARKTIVNAIKGGNTLVLDIGDVPPNFNEKICKGKNRTSFPIEVFHNGGSKMYEPKSRPRYEKIFRDEDMEEGGTCLARPGFRTLVVTSLKPDGYEDAMKELAPLHHMEPLLVRHDDA